jgi:hypothetical protein
MFEITFPGFDDLQDRIQIAQGRITGDQLKKPLSKMGKILREDTKARIAAAEDYPPLAPSTIAHREHTGTSLVNKRGEIRASQQKRIERTAKRLRGYIAWTQNRYLGLGKYLGVPESAKKRIVRWQKQLAALDRQMRAAQDTWYEDRKIGKRLSERWARRPLLGRLPGTIRFIMDLTDHGGAVLVNSRWKRQAAVRAHDQGDGHVPKRQVFKLLRKHIDQFRRLLIEHGIGVIWGGE